VDSNLAKTNVAIAQPERALCISKTLTSARSQRYQVAVTQEEILEESPQTRLQSVAVIREGTTGTP
jgi:hypothetical protein